MWKYASGVEQDASYIKFPGLKIFYDKIDKKWFTFGGEEELSDAQVKHDFPKAFKYVQTFKALYQEKFDNALKEHQEQLDRNRTKDEESSAYQKLQEHMQEVRKEAVQDFLRGLYDEVQKMKGTSEEKYKAILQTITSLIKSPDKIPAAKAASKLVLAACLTKKAA